MKGKKFLTLSLTVAMLAGGAMSVSAAGVSDVFNAGYYTDKYDDLKTTFGTDAAALLQHFMTSGAKEGRVMSPILDVVAYRNAYADLNLAYGDNWDAYVDHYLTYGIKEKRTTGVLFDLVDYANKNPDVKAAYGDDYASIAKHYVTFGIKENRPGGTIVKATPATPAASNSGNSGNSGNTGSTGNTTVTTPNNTASSDEEVVKEMTAAHVHIKGDRNGDGVVNGDDRISFLTPTCDSKGYNEWLCTAPVMVNRYDAAGNFIGTAQLVDRNNNLVFCNTQWKEELNEAHVAPSVDANIHWVHPTCTSAGVMAYVCERCGKYIKEDLEQLQHDYVKTDIYVESKSCKPGDEGYDRWVCKNCGRIDDRKRPLLNHQIGAARNVKVAATCTTNGVAYGHCDVCAREVEEIIPMTGHAPATHGANNQWFSVYADSYLIADADAGNTQRTHILYEVRYCKDCLRILEVKSDGDGNIVMTPGNCEDNNVQADGSHGDGACDICQLQMNRTGKNQIKFYQEGQKFYGTVQ